MKSIKQIADQQLLLSKYKDKRITSYDQILRLVRAGTLKAKKVNDLEYGVTESEIRKYNKRIELYKKT